MSYCKEEGKDRVIFVTKEDHDEPIETKNVKKLIEDDDDDEMEGLILPNGEINWNCPCLGGMASGPCGVEFRDAFSCFHYSETEVKGSDCIDNFRTMQECMVQYPDLYPVGDDREKKASPEEDAGDSKKEEQREEGIISRSSQTAALPTEEVSAKVEASTEDLSEENETVENTREEATGDVASSETDER